MSKPKLPYNIFMGVFTVEPHFQIDDRVSRWPRGPEYVNMTEEKLVETVHRVVADAMCNELNMAIEEAVKRRPQ